MQHRADMQQSLEKFEISVTPSLENPLCLPLHNLPDSMFDGLIHVKVLTQNGEPRHCLLYTSPSPRDYETSRMPSSA